MTLNKQSIRQNHKIYANNKLISKEELIAMSESWTEGQENFFRKMLKQGAFRFKINDVKFQIKLKNNEKS